MIKYEIGSASHISGFILSLLKAFETYKRQGLVFNSSGKVIAESLEHHYQLTYKTVKKRYFQKFGKKISNNTVRNAFKSLRKRVLIKARYYMGQVVYALVAPIYLTKLIARGGYRRGELNTWNYHFANAKLHKQHIEGIKKERGGGVSIDPKKIFNFATKYLKKW